LTSLAYYRIGVDKLGEAQEELCLHNIEEVLGKRKHEMRREE
jgi:hypothetical protein